MTKSLTPSRVEFSFLIFIFNNIYVKELKIPRGTEAKNTSFINMLTLKNFKFRLKNGTYFLLMCVKIKWNVHQVCTS